MDKFSICRMCLKNDVPMRSIFETDDSRLILACYICCAILHNCYKFRMNCFHSEELLRLMLKNELTPESLQQNYSTKMLKVAPMTQTSYSGTDNVFAEGNTDKQTSMFVVEVAKQESTEAPDNENSQENGMQSPRIMEIKSETKNKYDENETGVDQKSEIINENEDLEDTIAKNIDEDITETISDQVTIKEEAIEKDDENESLLIPREQNYITSHETVELKADTNQEQPPTNKTVEIRYGCELCNKRYGKTKRYECDICNKLYGKEMHTVKSYHIAKIEKIYECSMCKRCFNKKSSFNDHLRTHTGEKPFKCNMCDKRFYKNCYLVKHTRTHTGEKPYECNVCKRSFATRGTLVRHFRVHSGEKSHKCDVCGKFFTEKSTLQRHMRGHTGEKFHKCEVCNKCFAEKATLDHHIGIHAGIKQYTCDICQKCFYAKGNLVSHIRSHTGEKPHQCPVCNKCFVWKSSLVMHVRTHTNDRPYECNVCESSFYDKRVLDRHVRTHKL